MTNAELSEELLKKLNEVKIYLELINRRLFDMENAYCGDTAREIKLRNRHQRINSRYLCKINDFLKSIDVFENKEIRRFIDLDEHPEKLEEYLANDTKRSD